MCETHHPTQQHDDDKGRCQEKKMEGKETSIRMNGVYSTRFICMTTHNTPIVGH